MTLGTLRDQVIYPDTLEDQRRKRVSDEELEAFLEKVILCFLVLLLKLNMKGCFYFTQTVNDHKWVR
mgnify:FL=1